MFEQINDNQVHHFVYYEFFLCLNKYVHYDWMLEQILNQMNVNDKVQVDKQVLVQDFERFYLLHTKIESINRS